MLETIHSTLEGEKVNKKTLLIKSAYFIELTEEEYQQNYDEINLAISRVIGKDIMWSANRKMKWESISTTVLDTTKMNCGRCNNCNNWVTNREEANPISELNNGAVVNGELLCDECLPEDHRWAF